MDIYSNTNSSINPKVLRIGLIFGFIIYSLFGILDYFMLPLNYKIAWIIRFAIIDPAIIVIFALSYSRNFIKNSKNIFRVLLFLGQVGIVSMIYFANPNEDAYWAYYAGLILVILWSGFIFRFKLFETVLFFITTVILYNSVAIFHQNLLAHSIYSKNFAWFLGNNFFLISASVLAIIGSYYLEKYKNELKAENRKYLKAKEKAEKSDMLKTAFIHNISHEIRTPLNGLMGFSNMIVKESIDSHKKITYAKNIQRSGKRLISIIDNILEISKIQTGQISINKKKFSLNQSLMILHNVNNDLINDQIEFKVINTIEDSNDIIVSDKERLNQILQFLIDNAIKFTEKGHIYIKAKKLKNNIEISVEDTGIGIDSESLKNIFKEFAQEEIQITRNYGGTGIGLSIAKALVELLDGKISVSSTKGKGSIFSITIPL